MSAKTTDLAKVQEIYDVILQTKRQMEEIAFTEERFLNPETTEDDLIAEGVLNRVLRVTEEAGSISDAVAQGYGFERRAASGVRNRLAHAYGDVDRAIIWEVVGNDFDALLRACEAYCADMGVDIVESELPG